MSDKLESSLLSSINSVPLLVLAGVVVTGLTAYKCTPEPIKEPINEPINEPIKNNIKN